MDSLENIIKVNHNLTIECPFRIYHGYSAEKQDRFYCDSHYDLQICIVMTGELEARYADFRTAIKAGQLFWTSCWEPHATRFLKDFTSYLVLTVSIEFLDFLTPFNEINWFAPFFAPPRKRPKPENRFLRRKILLLCREMLRLEKSEAENRKTLQWMKIHELIISGTADWQDSGTNSMSSDIARIMPALQLAKKRLKEPSTIQDAATVCNLSKSHFSSIFTKTMGVSYARFALRCRLSVAGALLNSKSTPIKKIASECGFQDISHFYHVFSRHFKCTPTEFRINKRRTLSFPKDK